MLALKVRGTSLCYFTNWRQNAAKYGALSRPDGKVSVDWQWNRIKLYLIWKEYGGPKITSLPSKQGLEAN
jgi:two-component sensor histidine kinase